VIVMISARIKDIMTILILGILISSAISAVVNILQYFSNESMLKSFVVWTMGSPGKCDKYSIICFVSIRFDRNIDRISLFKVS